MPPAGLAGGGRGGTEGSAGRRSEDPKPPIVPDDGQLVAMLLVPDEVAEGHLGHRCGESLGGDGRGGHGSPGLDVPGELPVPSFDRDHLVAGGGEDSREGLVRQPSDGERRDGGVEREPFRLRRERAGGAFEHENRPAVSRGEPRDDVREAVGTVDLTGGQGRELAVELDEARRAETTPAVAGVDLDPASPPTRDGQVEVRVGVEVADENPVGALLDGELPRSRRGRGPSRRAIHAGPSPRRGRARPGPPGPASPLRRA